MADKRVRRLDQRAYRLWRLAQRLRERTGRTAETLPEDDWFDTVTFEWMTVTCRPTVPLDPDEPWMFTVHTEGAHTVRGRERTQDIEIDADTMTPTGEVEVRGGNVGAAAEQIIGLVEASAPSSAMA